MAIVIGKVGALAAVLVLLALVRSGGAEAAMTHDAHHDHHAVHHAAAADPAPAPAPADEGGPHHGHDCHCVSAACSPVLAGTVPVFVAVPVVATHARPPAHDAAALAGVDPPPEPPRT